MQLEHVIYKLTVKDEYCSLILDIVVPVVVINDPIGLKEVINIISTRLKLDEFYSNQIYTSLLDAMKAYSQSLLE